MSGDERVTDAEGVARRLTAGFGPGLKAYADGVFGGHCVNCEERWALPASQASCPHVPICEECFPNGCVACEAKIEAELRHRAHATNAITKAVAAMIESCDSLTISDLQLLDWRVRGDLAKELDAAMEAMRRITDTLKVHERRVTR